MGVAPATPSFPLRDLSIAVLVASCAARSPLRATPRFRAAPAGSIDSGRSKQTGFYLLRSLFCSLVPRSIKQPQNVHNALHKCCRIAYSEVHGGRFFG
jgi:hypothetical protein